MTESFIDISDIFWHIEIEYGKYLKTRKWQNPLLMFLTFSDVLKLDMECVLNLEMTKSFVEVSDIFWHIRIEYGKRLKTGKWQNPLLIFLTFSDILKLNMESV